MPSTDAPSIETTALTKVYPGRVTALDGLTVSVAPGVTGLVGANGAGKSTLIKILLGLVPPTKGQATVLGHDCQTSGEAIRALLGYMPEHDCLPPDVTATEFVTHLGRISGLPPTVAKERAAESLRHVGLHEERYRLIGTYSTGMKQRVKLAQALVGAPRLMLLDEPTNGLDPAGRIAMLELIGRIGAEFGISIVVASHLLGEIERICDHLVAIDGGRLLRADSPSCKPNWPPAACPSPLRPGRCWFRSAGTTRTTWCATAWLPWPCRCAGSSSGGTRSRNCSATGRNSSMPDAGVRAQHQPGGVIHDLGYRGYDGPRLGRVQIVKALTWHSFRSAFGIGRGVKGKIVPVLTFIAMCLPALVNAFAVARGDARLFGYDVYTPSLRVALVTIFIAAQAPELVSRDLRSRVLPLYFCRPLRRGDYPLAKYLAMTGALLVLIEVPLLLLYVGTIASAKDGSAVWHETRALIPGLGVGLMWALLFAAIGLVLASFTGRRAYSTGIVAISCVLTFFLALLLIQAEGGQSATSTGARIAGLFSPFTILDGVRVWLGGSAQTGLVADPGRYGPLYGVLAVMVLAACLGGLAARYRKASQS
jgi:ABC-type multidrug transport system ATPase subunit/ABC-type transport system involved in multi-copper enzyme maturation permease subunit